MAREMTTNRTEVVAMEWPRFLEWFRRRWRPGDHVALIGPTGTGKTTFAVGILPLRKYVLAIDPKGGDSTLSALTKHGFRRSTTWPISAADRRRIEKGEPVRLIMGPVVRTRVDRDKQRVLLEKTLEGAFVEGGWTIYVDELQLLADRRMMKLGTSVEENLVAARDRGVSMVCSFQRPANVPRAASDQASYLFLWYTRDVDVVNRLGEMAGRPKSEIRGAVSGLAKYSVLGFSRDPTEPILVIRPPRP